jgi:EPS-associated MarR family transcriptional regulator
VTPKEQARFRILKHINSDPHISQQELAVRLGVSVGKVNYLIRALVEKGLVKIDNFHRADGKLRKIACILTPSGISERIHLTQGYLARKEVEYEALKAEIDSLRNEAFTTSEGIEA